MGTIFFVLALVVIVYILYTNREEIFRKEEEGEKEFHATDEERLFVQGIVRRQKASIILFMLFLPASLLSSKIFPESYPYFIIGYLLAAGAYYLPLVFAKCPRCGKPFTFINPDWENLKGSLKGERRYKWYRSADRCQHCGFGARDKKKV